MGRIAVILLFVMFFTTSFKNPNIGLISYLPAKVNEGGMLFDMMGGDPLTGVNSPYFKGSSCYLYNTAYMTSSTQDAYRNLGNQFTLSFWGKRELSNSGLLLTCVDLINNKSIWNLQHTTGGNFQFAVISAPNTTNLFVATGSSTTTNLWRHYVGVYDGTQSVATSRVRLYWDGVEQSGTMTGTIPTSLQNPQNTTVRLGGGLAGTYVSNSYMQLVELYNRPLTATEVRNLYTEEYNIVNKTGQ